jgi:molybdopterin synthase sulfur carrier subunit
MKRNNEKQSVEEKDIRVRVKFFAAPREALGTDEINLQIPEGSTVKDLIDVLRDRYPVLESYTRFLNVAVNRAYVGMQTELHDGDEVACMPPVGGG